LRIRIGRLASRAEEDDFAGTSCRAGIVYLLSAETDISSHDFSSFGEEVVDGSAEPTLMTVDVDGFEACFERIGQTVVDRRACKLNSP
jgi:hypothetical protein